MDGVIVAVLADLGKLWSLTWSGMLCTFDCFLFDPTWSTAAHQLVKMRFSTVATRPPVVLYGADSCTVTSHWGTVPSDSTMPSAELVSSLGSFLPGKVVFVVHGKPPKPACAQKVHIMHAQSVMG
jgi:hypothetical protein